VVFVHFAESVYFVENLARIMEQKGMTRYRLAQLVPCSQSTVANWFNGAIPRGLTKARLLEVLGVSDAELFGDNKNSPAPKEGEAERAEVIRLYEAAPAWLQDQVRSLLKAAESGHAAQGADSKDQ
jgi:transcriptional regulator with XRE-family HTH domain